MTAIAPELLRAASSALGQTARPGQIRGAALLVAGRNLVEMGTGEGKTLMAALAAAQIVRSQGRRVHVFTANAYLARRDAEAMAPFYAEGGLSVSYLAEAERADRKSRYAADIVYGTPHDFCFDYLYDRRAMRPEDVVQPPLSGCVALIDEADAVLLDMARLPYALSERVAPQAETLRHLVQFVSALQPVTAEALKPALSLIRGRRGPAAPEPDADYVVDADKRQVWLPEQGYNKLDAFLEARGIVPAGSAYTEPHAALTAELSAALRAVLYRQGVDYLVTDTGLVLLDGVTGRPAPGRVLGERVHQALEAREGLPLSPVSMDLVSMPLQDYLSGYARMTGMTGTAWADRHELQDTYGLTVRRVAPVRPSIRVDEPDRMLPTRMAKLQAVLDEMYACHSKGQPVLVNAGSLEDAQTLYEVLRRGQVPAHLLTARNIEAESEVVARAGLPGAITLTVNLAGRGTDIVLGGPNGEHREAVLAAGGLRVIGTERAPLTRVDNQLRGRAGRQGDPGSSVFFTSPEDAIFASLPVQRLAGLARVAADPFMARVATRLLNQLQSRTNGLDWEVRTLLSKADGATKDARHAYFAWRDQVIQDPATLRRAYAAVNCEVRDTELETAWRLLLEEADGAWQAWQAALPELQWATGLRALLGACRTFPS